MTQSVYVVTAALNDFAGLYLLGDSAAESIRPVDGRAMKDRWTTPRAAWELERQQPLPDFTEVDLLLGFTTEAVDRLSDVLDGRGELLPLNVVQGPPAVAFNVTRLVDNAFDEERSAVDRFDDGRIMEVDEPVFRPDLLAQETIFKLAAWPKRSIFVTDTFVNAARREGIRGMRLRKVWPADETREPKERDPREERVYGRLVPGPEDIGPPQEPVAHHIIPPLEIHSPELERAQAHAQALGIDPDEAANGVWLSRERHERAYTDTYFKQLWERFRHARTREEGVNALAGIAQDLEAGRFPAP
jgi:hypothetical protein